MRKIILMAVLAGIFALFGGCGNAPVQTLEDALAQAEAAGKPVLIDFFTEW